MAIPYNAGWIIYGPSPRTQRMALSLRKEINIIEAGIANITGLTGATNSPSNFLYAGAICQLGSDGNWYWYGVTLPSGVTAVTLATGVPSLAVTVDSYDTNFNGANNPIVGNLYIGGAFLASFLNLGGTGNTLAALYGALRLNDILFEGVGAVTTQGYGPQLPLQSAPV